jgi:cell division protein FtsL
VKLPYFLLAVLVLANIATAVGIVHALQQHRTANAEFSRLLDERDELNIEFSRLQLEQATWSEPNRIEQVATEKLGMQFPEAADVVVLRSR